MVEPCDLSAIEARRLIGAKKLSPVELMDSCLKRIDQTNGVLNAIVAMDVKAAKAAAKAAERAVMRGDELGLLHGLPVGIKDLEATKGLTTTYGSLIYKDHVPEDDDGVVANVRGEGGVIVGKTNTPEFGAGAQTTNKVYGTTGNPFDPAKTCAGSSGGSAVALAAGQVMLATGSDYGGSLRTPSAYCGVVGFRPSPGVVPSATRAVALSPFSVSGPMARSVADAHLLLRAQLEVSPFDPYSSDNALRIPDELSDIDLSSVRAAFSTTLGVAPVDAGIARVFQERTKSFRGVFAEARDQNPELEGVHDIFEVLRGVNFVASHHDRLLAHRDLLGRNVVDGTERGLQYGLLDVARAHAGQSVLYREFLELFEEVDVLICPAAAVSPFPHEQLFVEEINGEKMPTYTRWIAITYALTTVLASVACIPCGVDHNGMPFGIQVVGPNGSDGMVLEVALALEKVLAADQATRRPVPDLSKLAR